MNDFNGSMASYRAAVTWLFVAGGSDETVLQRKRNHFWFGRKLAETARG
jgi:hypothetical protein